MKLTHCIFTWVIAIFACFIAGLLAIPLVPIAVMFATKVGEGAYRLPYWARWLETNDERDGILPGGLYEPAIRKIYEKSGWRWASIRWLWRNRAYRFNTLFQFRPDPETAVVDARGRLDVGAEGPGFMRAVMWDRGRIAFEVYWVKKLYGNRGIRMRIGYKLQPLIRNDRADWPDTDAAWDKSAWAMPILFFSPFSSVKG